MMTFLGGGVVLGLSAGFSPGPLQALVLSQTLLYGTREGIKVALAPLLTDCPIIVLSLFVLAGVNSPAGLGLISLCGGMFVLYLAYRNLRTAGSAVTVQGTAPRSFLQGALVNALSPHPYLFWLTVGAPTMRRAWTESALVAGLFVAGFYGCLVGSKVLLAILAGRSRHALSDRTYAWVMRGLGVFLALFAIVLLRDGVRLLGTR